LAIVASAPDASGNGSLWRLRIHSGVNMGTSPQASGQPAVPYGGRYGMANALA
jgi:hypothetical protein